MGASKSTLSSQRRLPKYNDGTERHEYIKNRNKDGDSDYDDELDSKIDSKEDLDEDLAKKGSLHGDGKAYYDDINPDKENDTKQLLPKDNKVFADDNSVAQLDGSGIDIHASQDLDKSRLHSA